MPAWGGRGQQVRWTGCQGTQQQVRWRGFKQPAQDESSQKMILICHTCWIQIQGQTSSSGSGVDANRQHLHHR